MARKHISPETRNAIRQEYSAGGVTQKELAEKHNLCMSTISNITNQTDEGRVPSEIGESDRFLKAIEDLEKRFPGAIDRIRKGFVKIIPAKIELVKY